MVFGFNTFLPPGFRIEISSDPNDPNGVRVIVPDPTETLGPSLDSEPYGQPPQGPMAPGPAPSYPGHLGYEGLSNRGPPPPLYDVPPPHNYPLSNSGDGSGAGLSNQLPHPADPRKPPVEFNHAINYVNRIKVISAGRIL